MCLSPSQALRFSEDKVMASGDVTALDNGKINQNRSLFTYYLG